jgi:peptide/nickel transport system substrate-binding protein
MKRRQFLATSALGLAAPSAPRIAHAASVLRFVPQADLAILDPVWTSANITRNHGYLVYDTLYGMDAEYRIQPQMVEGHVVEQDGRRWRVTLREGLRFHDGEPVRAVDVVASIRRWAARDAFGGALMAATDTLSAPSDGVVEFRLKRPFPLLPEALGKPGVNMPCIMPERLARTDANTRVTEVVGSGPFRFVPTEWSQGNRVVYERFDGYVPRQGGRPSMTAGPKVAHFDRVEWVIIPDPSTAAAALAAGEVDWWERPTPDLLPLLRRNRRVTVRALDPTGALQFLRFNHLHPPFDNAAIRRAVVGAVSQQDYMIAAAGTDPAMWDARCGAFTPGMPMASQAGMERLNGPRDLARVRRDLEAAGYRGEPVVFLGISDVPEIKAVTEVAADMFRRIGMNLDYQVLDWNTVLQRRTSVAPPAGGGWNIHHSGFPGLDMATPASNLALRGNGRAAWFGWPSSPRLEELRAAWFDAPDVAAQKRICDDMQMTMFEEVPYIPLGLIRRAMAWRADLADMVEGGVVFHGVRRA